LFIVDSDDEEQDKYGTPVALCLAALQESPTERIFHLT
jgi:hypothetical protein